MALDGALKTNLAKAWRIVQRLTPARPKLTILYYHAVPTSDLAAFERQMAWLARNANVVGPDHDGPLDAARPNVAITFDDAFESVAANAVPVLARHGLSATIFVPTGWLGRAPGWAMESDADREERVMDGAALQALPPGSIRFGSHTVDHPRLTQLPPAEREDQLVRSRRDLESLLGSPIDTLAFPYGDHDQLVVEAAHKAGFRYVYSILPEAVRPGTGGLCRGRTAVDAGDPLDLFILKAHGAYEWMPAAIRLKRLVRTTLKRRAR